MEREAFEAKVTEIAAIGHYVPTFMHAPYHFRGSLAKGDEQIVITTGNGKFASDRVGRFRVTGYYPEPEFGHMHGIKSAAITMTDTKTAAQMEAEIQRRFRGRYLDELSKAIAQVNMINERQKQTDAAAQAISNILDAEVGGVREGGTSWRRLMYPLECGIDKVEVIDADHIQFCVSLMPFEKALKLAEFMKAL